MDLDNVYETLKADSPTWKWVRKGLFTKSYPNVELAKRALKETDSREERWKLRQFLYAVYKTLAHTEHPAAKDLQELLFPPMKWGRRAYRTLLVGSISWGIWFGYGVRAADFEMGSRKSQLINREVRTLSQGVETLHIIESQLGIRSDPSLQYIDLIDPTWLTTQLTDKYELANILGMISRNLYFDDKPPTPENVRAQEQRIAQAITNAGKIPLFAGRNVIVAASAEVNPMGEPAPSNSSTIMPGTYYRFFPADMELTLKKESSKLSTYRFEGRQTENSKKKRELLNGIEKAARPLTIMLITHGAPKSIEFENTDGTHTTLEVEDLADAIIKRWKKASKKDKSNLAKRDIIISTACMDHEFMRTLIVYLQEHSPDTPLPVLVAAAEYGQYAFSNFDAKYNSRFFELGLQLAKGTATIGTVVQQEKRKDMNSNITIYIPLEDELLQIAEIPTDRDKV